MKVVEVKEDIRDTSISRDIFDIAKISQRINLYSEFITDLNGIILCRKMAKKNVVFPT